MAIPKQPFEPDREGPLRGVRVLDFSRLVAGNMLSLQLAEFGAEVVKVESPGVGDTLRDWREAGVSVHWKVYARNKKSVTLDLKASEAPGIILVPRLSDTPGRLRCPAPAVGQHNRETFSRIGYSDERIAALAQKGVI